MSDKPKLVTALADDARFNPLKCVAQLASDIVEGKVKARRVVIVVEIGETATEDAVFQIRASGPGMDYSPTAVGLLHLAATELSITAM